MRFDGSVGRVTVVIDSLDDIGGLLLALLDVSSRSDDFTLRGHAQQVVPDTIVVDLGGGFLPLRADLPESLPRQIGSLVQNRHQIAVPDDLSSGVSLGFNRVGRLEFGAVGRRTKYRRVKHILNPDITGIEGLALNLFDGVPPAEGLADQVELFRFLGLWFVVQLSDDPFSPGEFAIADTVSGLRVDHIAFFDPQAILGNSHAFGGQLRENRSGLGGGGPHCRSEEACRHGAESAHIPGAQSGVTHDHLHPFERYVQLLREHLCQRRHHSLAHLDLSRETGNLAVLVDSQEGV